MRFTIDANDPAFESSRANAGCYDIVLDGALFDLGLVVTADDVEGLVRYAAIIPGTKMIECWPDGSWVIREARGRVVIVPSADPIVKH